MYSCLTLIAIENIQFVLKNSQLFPFFCKFDRHQVHFMKKMYLFWEILLKPKCLRFDFDSIKTARLIEQSQFSFVPIISHTHEIVHFTSN